MGFRRAALWAVAILAGWCTAVEILTDATFQSTVESSGDLWLVDFYAPWCHACKKLDPVLAEASSGVEGMMRIGKVDVTENTKLEAQFNIQRYPTVLFRTPNGAWKPYGGDRSVSSVVAFARRMSGEAVKPASTLEVLKTFHATESSVFILATGAETSSLELNFRQAALFVAVQNLVPRAIAASYLTTFLCMNGTHEDLGYRRRRHLSLGLTRPETWVPLGRDNLRAIGMSHKLLVVACFDPSVPEHEEFEARMAAAASLRDPIVRDRSAVAFGWLDADRYDTYLAQFYVDKVNIPTYFVLNMQAAKEAYPSA
ncbi:disulfide-isomerase TMX3 [Achlya hypogyna]|uniref:Disulfide-isomerase TMX3 n=1 Tax=Achlya hypogyna TaxID=1202772 RepID=A0A1V9ZNW3_ACHHY|nr:disulfide-isomerase TMX3 [Achlya hypogyna]